MTSSSSTAVGPLAELARDFCWGVWAELGVSGWRRTHRDWAIDPEPLLVFTSWIGADDPRLRDESLDWCIESWRHISKIRLKNLVHQQGDSLMHASWGEYAATVNDQAGLVWPGATLAQPAYRRTGKSRLPALEDPALVCLRMRVTFGLAARAEILRLLLLGQPQQTVAQLADGALYTKRNVAEECDMLARAGVLAVKADGNRFLYSLADPRALAGFVGELPSVRPDWRALLRVVMRLVDLEQRVAVMTEPVRNVEVQMMLRAIEGDLDTLGIARPGRRTVVADASGYLDWAQRLLTDLAQGLWPSR